MNSRKKGIKWELKIRKEFISLFPGLVSSRSSGKNYDDVGIDLFDPTGQCPFYIQVKATKRAVNLQSLYDQYKELIEQSTVVKTKPLIIVKVYFPTQVEGKRRTRRDETDIIVFTSSKDLFDVYYSLDCGEVVEWQPTSMRRQWREKLKESNYLVYKNEYTVTTLKHFKQVLEKCLTQK